VSGRLLDNLVLFGRMCRALGMRVTPHVTRDVAQALTLIDVGRRADVYHAMRCLMVMNRRDLAIFDLLFGLFWQPPANNPVEIEARVFSKTIRKQPMRFLLPPGAQPDDPETQSDTPLDMTLNALVPTYSMHENLRYKHFSEMTSEELALAKQLMARLPWSLGVRRSRRYGRGAGRHIDLRQTLRGSLRYGGETLALAWRAPRIKPRPLVLLCDISGSMERYTRILMHFTHTLANSMYQVESFVFATRLTRITRAVRRTSVEAALSEIGHSVADWGAGTRTGEALHAFNHRWSRRVLGRGAVVLLITDGWDRGDPELLRKEAERLHHSCYRLIWLNPLLGAAGYEPLTRGAQALLPHVDDFLPIHNLASLETLAHTLAGLDL
jgi:uncharacterized protein with von Willebrand factor type A (vWA) domain